LFSKLTSEYLCHKWPWVTNDHGYVPFVVLTTRSFPHPCLISGCVTRVTRRVPHVEQKLLILLEHRSLSPVFSGVRVARSLVFCAVYCRSLFVRFLLAIVLSVLLQAMASDYPYDIIWPLCCLFFFKPWLLITLMISFGHCVVCSSSSHGFWLPLWYHLANVLSVLLQAMASDYPYDIFWPLCCLFFFKPLLLITLMIYFGHCVVCSSSSHGFWLPLWYLQEFLTIGH
jgi:hypothetical protein